MGNSNNPYDEVGQLHNQGCEYLFEHGITQENFSSQSLLLVKEFTDSMQLDGTENLQPFFASTSWTNNFTNGQPFTTLDSDNQIINIMWTNNAIDSTERNYLNNLLSVIDGLDAALASNDDDPITAYSIVNNNFVTIENEIVASPLNEGSKKTLLSAAAVGRYSLGFWINHWQDQNPIGTKMTGATATQTVKGIAKKDLNYAAAASVGWGVYTAIIGGGAGWLASVVSGGVCGSVYEALSHL